MIPSNKNSYGCSILVVVTSKYMCFLNNEKTKEIKTNVLKLMIGHVGANDR